MRRVELTGWASTQRIGIDGTVDSEQRVTLDRPVVDCSDRGARELAFRYWAELRRSGRRLMSVREHAGGIDLRLLGFGPVTVALGPVETAYSSASTRTEAPSAAGCSSGGAAGASRSSESWAIGWSCGRRSTGFASRAVLRARPAPVPPRPERRYFPGSSAVTRREGGHSSARPASSAARSSLPSRPNRRSSRSPGARSRRRRASPGWSPMSPASGSPTGARGRGRRLLPRSLARLSGLRGETWPGRGRRHPRLNRRRRRLPRRARGRGRGGCSPPPKQARHRPGTRVGRRAADDAAGGGRRRQGQRSVRDHRRLGRSPPGDGRPTLGLDSDAADRARRHRAVSRCRRRERRRSARPTTSVVPRS